MEQKNLLSSYLLRNSLLAGLIAIAYSCATPTSPSGGPADQEGPRIVNTRPATGTTNFEGRSITLEFSEFVNRSSITGAIVIEPDIGISYSLDWGRKSVTIKFDESLPDLTTLIVTIGTNLRDMNGNKLASPQKIAVSTGPEIDEGKLRGRIIDAATGEGTEGQRVLLYRSPVDLTQKANYVAETDTGGTFQFSYLRQGEYKAFWVDDRNRNKIWDRERERAQPFGREFITLEKSGSDTLQTLFVARTDTSQPDLQGLGLFSSRRMRIRFSESIQLTDSTTLAVTDTLGNAYAEAYPLYVSPAEPFVLFAQSSQNLLPENSYLLQARNISDLSDNVRDSMRFQFSGSAQEDTTQQRIISLKNSSGIFPTEAVSALYAKPIAESSVTDSLKVVAGTELVEQWPQTRIVNNELQVHPREEWKRGLEYEVRFWNPRKSGYKNVSPLVWHPGNLGAVFVQYADTTDTRTHRLMLRHNKRGLVADTAFTGSIELTALPPLQYRLIMYHDANGNGRWDTGSVDPFEAPEPYYIRRSIPIREGFTSDLTVSYR